ncbi:cytochrome b/b6 domain-containing protein [Corynebacterium hylobatis]|uniref:cytochrome b/b6 domain-containing protein n=1 Tax=Corynebacterium hylobatis TaxID=1859290 RepID=UPI001F49D386|nr:cytochrome b/b6 domain-containing protein [Corynebacterium hylobatis]
MRTQLLTPLTRKQWSITGGFILLVLIVGAAIATLAARWLVGLEPVAEFITRYPGEYELPENTPTGIPAWVGWQHFFNMFFLFLIIRTGIQINRERRPRGYWRSKRGGKKISLILWIHLVLDLLWIVNGAVFYILLFATGHWARIVPTSWEVFPNAISAGLQYLSLDWPTHNSWVNYNSLQELAYFITVFIAAPLAILTGLRLSEYWPKNNKALSNAFPIALARGVHLPVMVYFVIFTVIHVILVFATGALRNLNHMYAAQDSTNWTGFGLFVLSLAAIVVGLIAIRPSLIAPLAQRFGDVTAR